jgi:hypothetical protein
MSWTHESGSKPTAADLRGMGIVPPEDYAKFMKEHHPTPPPDSKDSLVASIESLIVTLERYAVTGWYIDREVADRLRVILEKHSTPPPATKVTCPKCGKQCDKEEAEIMGYCAYCKASLAPAPKGAKCTRCGGQGWYPYGPASAPQQHACEACLGTGVGSELTPPPSGVQSAAALTLSIINTHWGSTTKWRESCENLIHLRDEAIRREARLEQAHSDKFLARGSEDLSKFLWELMKRIQQLEQEQKT